MSEPAGPGAASGAGAPRRPADDPKVTDLVRVDRRGPVVVVTLDRPDRRNALNRPMVGALTAAVTGAVDSGARVLLLSGAGGHFSSGADLLVVRDKTFRDALGHLLHLLCDADLITIAAVEGAALGAGLQLAVACDLRIATPDAAFGVPAARLGVMVDYWTAHRLALLAGHGPARSMLLAAEVVSGTDAHRLGLVQRIGDLAAAETWASGIASLAPLTVLGHKRSLNAMDDDGNVTMADVEEALRRAWSSSDLEEGIAAFREQRPPRFRGK